MRKRDHNDVFGSTMFFSHQDPAEREYEDAMEVYRESFKALPGAMPKVKESADGETNSSATRACGLCGARSGSCMM